MCEHAVKRDIIEIGKRMYNKGFIASNDGNISVRVSENDILITASGVSKGYMNMADIVKIDKMGHVVDGSAKPSSEMKMHIAVYRSRNDVKAIVHAHPPKTTAFAVTHTKLDKVILPEVVFSLGNIAVVEYSTPTTKEVPRAVEKYINVSDVIILANHGALTVGNDIYDAYFKMETLEHFATISLYAKLIGNENYLDEKQVKELIEIRTKVYGKPHIKK